MSDSDDRLTLLTEGGDAAPAGEGGLRTGDLVGGYRIESVAGRGGMGIVYRATDPELGRLVALKVISPERSDDPRFRELFVRESLNASALEHPNVIPIYRAGEDEGRLYIAMRFVDGVSLQDLIAEHGPLPAGRAARILSRVAGALDAAHARGLVHRDVKPANVLIADPDGDEHVYLTDFGLSTRAARDAAGGPGGWAGTLAYLAPEQIRGEPLDARTDVYALGCVLFHCLTGRVPFPGGEDVVSFAHLNDPVPRPTELAPDVPPAMDEVVARAMAKRPEDRYASAGELARAALAARFDIALCHSAAQAGAADRIAALLRDRGLQPVLASGDGAAEAVRSSGGCAVLLGPDGLGAWARDALAAATDLAERDRAFRVAAVLCPGGPEALDPGLTFFANRPWADLRDGIEGSVEDLLRALRAASPPVLGSKVSDTCPYRGLEAFEEEHADDFFGREDDVAGALERLRTGRFLAVVGASGSGKSSLLRAGIVPAIRRGALPGGEAWRVLTLTPGARPLTALAAQLASLPGGGAPSPTALAAGPRAVDLAVAHALDGAPPEERVLFLVDQMEELFTLCADAGEREAFMRALVYAATIPGGRTVVVTAMRADFYHRLADHPELRTLVAARQQALGPLDAAGLRRAIEKPAARAGLELEPGLTRRILTDVSGRPGTLPLMEHLLYELWQRRRGSMLTLEAYGASGGVEGSLARRANASYEGLSPERQAIARRVLLRLTQPGEGTEDTRRRASLRELATSPEERPEVEAVVGALAEARLLTTGRDEASGEPVVDVMHEALIRGWPELRAWIDEDREGLRLHRRLTEAASEWEAAGHDESLLYRGTRVGLWDERDLSPLNDVEREFLAASRERAQRDRAARRRRVRVALGGLGAAVAIVTGLAIFAFVQRSEASDERDLALSRQIAASAREALPSDPELAVLLALRAYQVRATPEARQILRQATVESRIRATLRGHTGRVWRASYSPDGRRVVSGGTDGTVRFWDADGKHLPSVGRAHRGEVFDVRFLPDGARALSAGEDGTVRVWDATSGRLLATPIRGNSPISALAVSKDGALVAIGTEDGEVQVHRLSGAAVAPPLRGHRGRVTDLAFSPDGRRLLSASADFTARLWSLDEGRTIRVIRHGNEVSSVDFAPDGRRFLTASADGSARIYAGKGSGRPVVLRRRTELAEMTAAAFSPDGRWVAAGTGQGDVGIWPVTGGPPRVVLQGHDGAVSSVEWRADGARVLSAGTDSTVRIWEWASGLPAELDMGTLFTTLGGVAFSKDGRHVLVAASDGSVREWNPASGQSRLVRPAGEEIVASALRADGRELVAARPDGSLLVVRAGEPPRSLRGHTGFVGALALSPRDERVVSGGDDGTVRVWDLDRGTPARVLRGHTGQVYGVAFSLDGRLVASGGRDGIVRVWAPETGRMVRSFRGHEGPVTGVAFSPDARLVASAGADRTVRIWHLDGSDAPIALAGHRERVNGVAFSPDGRLLLSSGGDALVVWDWSRDEIVMTVPTDASFASFSGDGRRIAAISQDGRPVYSLCEVCGSIDDVRRLAGHRVTRSLSGEERRAFKVNG